MVHRCCSAAPSMPVLNAGNHGDRRKHAHHMKEAQLPSQGSMADIRRKHDYNAWPALEGRTSAIK